MKSGKTVCILLSVLPAFFLLVSCGILDEASRDSESKDEAMEKMREAWFEAGDGEKLPINEMNENDVILAEYRRNSGEDMENGVNPYPVYVPDLELAQQDRK